MRCQNSVFRENKKNFINLSSAKLAQRVVKVKLVWYDRNLSLIAGRDAQLDARPTGDQEAAGSTPAGSATFFRGDLFMKYFLRSFSPFRWLKKGSCQFLAKECAQYWLTAYRTKPAQ